MRTTKLIFPLLLAALAAAPAGLAAERNRDRGGDRGDRGDRGGERGAPAERAQATTVRGVLIIASNDAGKADSRLAPYESILQNNLRFRSFKFVTETSASVPAGGRATLNLQGNRVELQGEAGGAVVASRSGTGVTLYPGRGGTVFLAGSAGGNGDVYGIIVVAR